MTQYRACFDAEVTFSNGGGLSAREFRVDVPGPDVTQAEVARLFVAALALLMTDRVELSKLSLIEEGHKGTRGGPSDPGPGRAAAVAEQVPARAAEPGNGPGSEPGREPEPEADPARGSEAPGAERIVELGHVIRDGMLTYPGLPAPEITAHLSREASRELYAEDTEFEIHRISMVGNTGTYLDTPFHRFEGGPDVSQMPLDRFVDVPAVVVRVSGEPGRGGKYGIGVGALAGLDFWGRAVLLHTGDSFRFGTPEYAQGRHFLTADGAAWLIRRGAILVGIDALNIDDIDDLERPAHTRLLGAGIPVVEHLTGLHHLPVNGSFFSAIPLRIEGVGTVPVRAFARIPE